MTQSTVATPTGIIVASEAKRALPRALMGGTDAMRAAGKTYLPQEPAESDKAYENRKARSFLFNGYGKTVKDMVGKVLAKPITYDDKVPPEIADPEDGWALNIDLAGRDINSFARDVFTDAFEGVSYILTDMDAPVDGAVTKAQAKELNRRPWLVHVKACQVLGWRSEAINGKQTLTQFRFMDDQSEPDGTFGEKPVKQIRVFTKTGQTVAWETWRQSEAAGHVGEWLLHEEGTTSLPDIAVVPVYTGRTGFFSGIPPLGDLAEVNQAHWQSQSDQRNILHVARVPILFGAGVPDEQAATWTIGASHALSATDKDASLTFVEHSGNAIGSGNEDLKNLEYQMQVLGLELLIPKPGGQSATGAVLDTSKANAPLVPMANGLEDALENALQFMAEYGGLETGGSVQVCKDFSVGLNAADAATILQAKKDGLISAETAIRELQRRGILSDAIDPEEEAIAALNDYEPVDPFANDTIPGGNDTLTGMAA